MYSARRRPGGGRSGRQGQQNYYLAISLFAQLARRLNELDKKPPVTVLLLGLNCVAYYGNSFVPGIMDFLPTVGEACLRPERLVRGESWLALFNPVRMIFSPILHGSEQHLFHNMMSLVNKGVQLELKHKPAAFALMTGFLALGSSSLYIVLSHLGEVMLGMRPSCAIGFSAILFGFKVIATLDSGRGGGQGQSFFGLHVPQGVYLSWLELVTIQMAYPQASFLGHLCGILCGWTYHALFMGKAGPGRGSFFNTFRSRARFHGSGTTGEGSTGRPSPSYARTQRTRKFN
ncbi:rhomboid domain-containing protein [Chloropicon primus]|uniref:Rhomboid domain-containing protein n=1 Tax=Chloropicon primus TaxID=1764295 RepID=A0A5B8MDS9_9CHLO|nr:rhomboid domain-containing protein [Chloropicon primus]UPQ97802.1 rhomboid domain-containing protein [Chloropicon primus]|mmetsp:Transcript_4654/g.13896  ORF Transcript_4654/g.13896 Transcript_4654/m.13896 type:complete len:289 (+) Transcript_4654:166-1032(+)|eukprot:QDZ18593.1 rhomboid domain-containing protein [Chloropicon primus]